MTRGLDDPAFLPALRPADWPGRGDAVCRPLLRAPGSPLVTYAWHDAGAVVPLTPAAQAAAGWSLDQVNRASIGNLSRREGRAPWLAYPGLRGSPLLLRAGDVHTAAALLLPGFMRKAHEALGVDAFVVGLPTRYGMWAADVDLVVAGELLALLASQFAQAARDGLEPVTPLGLHVQDGKVAGLVRAAEALPEADAP